MTAGAAPGGAAGISLSGVSRAFDEVVALADATFTAPAGNITALIGPNGSGKTTLLKVIAGLTDADQGTVRVGNLEGATDRREIRRQVGWMPDVFEVSQDMTVREILMFFATAYQLERVDALQRIEEILELTLLVGLADSRVQGLSRGEGQRLSLARALLHRPPFLLLDEPDSGLDTASRVRFRSILRDFSDAGGTVLLSSHDLNEMQEVADGVVVIHQGRTTAWRSLRHRTTTTSWRISSLDPDLLATHLSQRGTAWTTLNDDALVGPLDPEGAAGVLRDVVTAGVRVTGFGPVRTAVEGMYDAGIDEP